MGRPPKYRRAMCAIALEELSQGRSLAGVAKALGVSRETIYEWKNTHQEFSDTIKKGLDLSLAWWEETLAHQAAGEKGNPAAAIFVLKNRWHTEYRDKIENEVSIHEIPESVHTALSALFTGNQSGNDQ